MTSLTKQLQSAEAGKYRLTPLMIKALENAFQIEPKTFAGIDPRQQKARDSIVGRWCVNSDHSPPLRGLERRGLAKQTFIAYVGYIYFLTDEGVALLSAAAVEGSDG